MVPLAGCTGSASEENQNLSPREPPEFDATNGRMFSEIEPVEGAIHETTNEVREEHGREPLRYDEGLAEIARFHSRNMAQEDFFRHTDHKNRSHRDRAELFGYTAGSLGENLYKSGLREGWSIERIARRSVDRWLQSTSHRLTMLDESQTEAGVGAYITEKREILVTALYSTQDGEISD